MDDVTSLYTSIRHEDGLHAVERFLDRREGDVEQSTSYVLRLIDFILKHNYFEYEGNHYLQKQGTAMGMKFAPAYANLYMAAIEQDFLASRPLVPVLWRRFLDDVFFIWEHGREALDTFLEALNDFSPLSFTHTISDSMITFLDVDVSLSGQTLSTKVHVKSTNA